MTYKEYDNTFIPQSFSPCGFRIDLMTRNLRNREWNIPDQYEIGTRRDFVNNATETVEEIGEAWIADPFWYAYTIGVEDYIFGVEQDEEGNVYLYEWNIPNKTKKTVFVYDINYVNRADFLLISYLEPHRVLTVACGIGPDKIYLVDFLQETATLELEEIQETNGTDYISSLYVTTINGDIMAFAGSIYGWVGWDGCWGVYYKNFTTNSDWTLSLSAIQHEDAWVYEEWGVVDEKYLCTTSYWDAELGENSPCKVQIICFNMETLSWQYSNTLNAFNFYPTAGYQYVVWMEPYYTTSISGNILNQDVTEKKLYFTNISWSDWISTPPGRTYELQMQFFGVYDPITNIFSTIYTNGWVEWNTTILGGVRTGIYTTPEHVYFLTNSSIFRNRDMSIITNTFPTWYYSDPTLDKDIVVYKTDNERYIYAVDIEGNILKTWDIGEAFDILDIRIVGNGLVVEGYLNSDDSIRQFLLK